MGEINIINITPENFSDYEEFISTSAVEMMNEGLCNSYVALDGDRLVGSLSVFYDEDTGLMEIINVYTVEDMRRNSIAFDMIDYAGAEIMEQNDYYLRGILASFEGSNEEAYGFFEALGFELIPDENSSKLTYTLNAIKNSYLMEKKYNVPDKYTLIRYSELDNIKRRTLISKVEELNGIYDMNFANDLNEELSISIWEGEEPVGTVEMICEENGELSLGQFFVVKMDTVILAVLQIIAEELFEKYSGDTKLSAYIISESSRNLITKLLGDDCEKVNLINAELNLVENYDVGEEFLD